MSVPRSSEVPAEPSRRILEFAASIRETFEPVILTNLYPRSQIDIHVQILQQDGGELFLSSTSLNGILTSDRRSSDMYQCNNTCSRHSRRSSQRLRSSSNMRRPFNITSPRPHEHRRTRSSPPHSCYNTSHG